MGGFMRAAGAVQSRRQLCPRDQLPLLCSLSTNACRRGKAIMYSQRACTAVVRGAALLITGLHPVRPRGF
jgi:hypothetical protein